MQIDNKPNIVFIMTDHQRADSLGMIQDGKEVTPNLNKLSKKSTVFKRCYNTCPLCVPARTALATGKYPTRNGAVFNDWAGERAGDHKTIHEYLSEDGYEVAHIGVDHIKVRPAINERIDFAKWITQREYKEYIKEKGFGFGPGIFHKEVMELRNGEYIRTKYSSMNTGLWQYESEDYRDLYFMKYAVDFLKNNQKKPFALFLYLWAPHPPLVVPGPYASLFKPEKIDLPPNVGKMAVNEPEGRRKGIAGQLGEGVGIEDWRKAWAAHLALTRLADDCVGEIIKTLEKSGCDEDTIIVFTSDHGEHLGQHAMYQKMEMYEQAIHVPFLIHISKGRAQEIGAPVSHLDIMPTLLDLAGIRAVGDIDGTTLVNTITDGIPLKDKPVFCQYSGNPALGDIRRAVIANKYKYIYDPRDKPELFDLENDPFEMNNLAGKPEYKKLQNKLHDLCRKWHLEHGDWVDYDQGITL